MRLQRYQSHARILPDNTIIHRPDCVVRCNEQTALCTMIAHIKLDDRLSVLRTEDQFRKWRSLNDERLCIICKRKFNGRQMEIRRLRNHKYELHCPTEGCNSSPHLWIYPATPLVSYALELDWCRLVGQKHRTSGSEPAAGGQRV